jgi:hypothetical protein
MKQFPKCGYPPCDGPARGKEQFCIKHLEQARFFLWMLASFKVKDPGVTDSGLILPK